MDFDAILFDADGVIQHAGIDYRAALRRLLGDGDDERLDRFTQEMFALERPALTGERDFLADMASALEAWGLRERMQDVLALWTAIAPDPAMQAAIRGLRARGVVCCLATNQQPYRRKYMSETLGYRELFDHEFYSCGLGYAKPDGEYFRAIARALAMPPERLLFLDDHPPNVTSARDVGLRAERFEPSAGDSVAQLRGLLARHAIALD